MKRNTFRLWFALGFTALTNGYVKGFVKGSVYNGQLKSVCVPGLNCHACPGAFGSCPMGSLQAVLSGSSYRIALYVFGLLGIFGTLFGRFVCGFLCPFGLVQELLHKIPFVKKTKNLPGHKYLRFIKYAILLLFVIILPVTVISSGIGKPWFCEYICPSGMLFGSIPLVSLNESLRNMIGTRFFIKMGILLAVLLASVMIYRPFCKYLCPLGAIYGLFNPVALYRYNFDKSKCNNCGACKKACDMDITVINHINSTECVRCGKCIDACTQGAITTSFDELRGRLKKHEQN